jgi:hypothetical protein
VPVEGHRRHPEALGNLPHADRPETALVGERDRSPHDGIPIES